MADEVSGAKKAPTALRIKLRYDDVDTFVERFAPNIARSGLFIRTRTPKPVGSELRFELRLSDDKPVVIGLGVVRWIKDYDPRKPRAVHGMGVEFLRVTRESREVLLRVLEYRKRHGLPDGERGLPVPTEDDEAPASAHAPAPGAAPILVDAAPMAIADQVSAPIPSPMPELLSMPASMRAPAAPPIAEPIAEPIAIPEPVAEPSPVALPAALAPEAPRRPRTSLASVVAAAAPSTTGNRDAIDDDAVLAFLGDSLDVAAAVRRARAFIGDQADAELDALLNADAAPSTMTADDASSRLAAMFGMPAISARRRSNRDGLADGTRETEPAAIPPPAPSLSNDVTSVSAPSEPPPPDDDDRDDDANEGVTHPVDALLLARGTRGDASTPDFEERTVIGDPTGMPAPAADAEPVDGATVAVPPPSFPPVPFDEGETSMLPARAMAAPLRPPPRHEFDERDIDTQVKRDTAKRAPARPTPGPPASLPPPPSRGKPRTMPPPLPAAAKPTPKPRAESAPPIVVNAASESTSGSIDITDLVAQLEAESAEPAAPRGSSPHVGGDESRDLAAQAMNADELLDGMRDIGRRRPPSGPAPDLASFADPPDAHAAPRGRSSRSASVDDALAALESMPLGDEAETTAVNRARELAPPRPLGKRRGSTPRPAPVEPDEDEGEIEVDIELDDLE